MYILKFYFQIEKILVYESTINFNSMKFNFILLQSLVYMLNLIDLFFAQIIF